MPSGGCLEPGKAWLYSFPFLYKKGYYTNTLNPTLALLFRVSLVAQMVKSLLVMWEIRVQSLGQKDPLRRKWQPTPVLLPGKAMDGGPWQALVHGITESDTTEQLHSLA